MSYERKDGDIAIFKNKKEKENQPDYWGTAIIDGNEMKVALWVKEGRSGKFMAGRIERDVKPQESKTDLL